MRQTELCEGLPFVKRLQEICVQRDLEVSQEEKEGPFAPPTKKLHHAEDGHDVTLKVMASMDATMRRGICTLRSPSFPGMDGMAAGKRGS